ncbi:MAG: hypothetical protein M3276_02105 [Actinomycetota bacterium]|nr:hypothetical protein [Actinomycetota bacterium]
MEITVRRTGGFAGRSARLGPVDTPALDPRLGQQIEALVESMGFFDLPGQFPPGGGEDTFTYLATVMDGARTHQTSWDDLSERPPQLDELLELILSSGATWQDAPFPTGPANPLFARWTHSHEEDTGDVEVYRPPGFAFPPSFPRRGFQINPDGVFARHGPGPSDEPVTVTGRWVAEAIRADFDDPGLGSETLRILSYDQDRLTLDGRSERRETPPPEPAASWQCGRWYASLDRQPPGVPVLRVTGSCRFPTAGYVAGLRRHEPQGTNPRQLLLDLVVHAPDTPSAQVLSEVEVRYEEETEAGFDSVLIFPEAVSVPVEEVW